MPSEDKYEIVKPILDTEAPPLLGPNARPGVLSPADVNDRVDELLAGAGITGEPAQLIRSLALLWHDHLDLSHEISQSIDGADGSYLHGIMHRREPDFGNAAYWFRRVGDHPMFVELAEQVTGSNPESVFTSKLVRDGRWNPIGMVDACEAVDVGSTDDGDAEFIREAQSNEFQLLLKRFCEM